MSFFLGFVRLGPRGRPSLFFRYHNGLLAPSEDNFLNSRTQVAHSTHRQIGLSDSNFVDFYGATCCRADGEVVEPRIYFKVIHTNPSGQHRVARPVAAGGDLRADHLAVSIVHCQFGTTPRYEVSGPTGMLLRERVSVLSYLHSDAAKLQTCLMSHDDDRALTCSLKGLEGCKSACCVIPSMPSPPSHSLRQKVLGSEPKVQIRSDATFKDTEGI